VVTHGSGAVASHPITRLAPRPHGTVPVARAGNLINHGGPVQTAPKVYLDFWGWGTGSDPSGEQTYLTNFLKSIGGTSWLSTVNQYGASSSPVLAGTWKHTATLAAHPTDAAIQRQAARAATHFNTGTSDNVEIVVATPTGHNTSGFGTQFCAYHGTVSADPNITYTNLPYMTDAGGSCGEDSVNGSSGTLDGVSIVEGHELAETLTDPLLNAWFDSSGQEIGDKCAWINLQDITTSAGQFAVQPLWSNSAGGCVQ
jgi:serine protease